MKKILPYIIFLLIILFLAIYYYIFPNNNYQHIQNNDNWNNNIQNNDNNINNNWNNNINDNWNNNIEDNWNNNIQYNFNNNIDDNWNNNIQNNDNNNNIKKFKSLGEELACETFEEYLNYKVYNNIRPDFLKNPETGRNLEFDIYDPITKIAIEYNGIQHYYYGTLHTSLHAFEKQKHRDIIKQELAYKNNIHLIHIPYYIDTCKFKNNKYIKIPNITREYRKTKIKEYLYPIFDILIT